MRQEIATQVKVAVVGAGPAGLMACEVLSAAGVTVDLYDGMPCVGAKFLVAGRGGLNLTHAEPFEEFVARYGERVDRIRPWLQQFGPDQLRDWAASLGHETCVGSSGKVFPVGMEAKPLLQKWVQRLEAQEVQIHTLHRWVGTDAKGRLRFAGPDGAEVVAEADAVLFALGGGSWPKTGSDGGWIAWFLSQGVEVAALRPANCGFDVGWSDFLRTRHEGEPIKTVALDFVDAKGQRYHKRGECLLTAGGLEGALFYALSAPIRDTIQQLGSCQVFLDLMPDWTLSDITKELVASRGSRSLASHMARRLGLKGVKACLLREGATQEDLTPVGRLAQRIKALPVTLVAPRPLEEAISSAGGVRFDELDDHLMLKRWPGFFCAGEMLDWEAPTGGYLLTACISSGRFAAQGILAYLRRRPFC